MPTNGPLKIGITGGIGAGKSVVCKIFKSLGIPVYDADNQAKKLMQEDPVLISQIIEHFGDQSYLLGNVLNRSYLSKKVFQDEEKLKILNQLVHPRVKLDFENWTIENRNAPYIIKEAALLIESGSYKSLDKIITVNAPIDIRIERVLTRDPHRDENTLKSIIERQMTERERQEKSDFVIENDGGTLVIPTVLKLHQDFLSASKV